MRRWLANALGRGAVALGYDAGERSNRYRKDLGWDRQSARDEDGMVGRDGSRERIRLRASDQLRNNGMISGMSRRLGTWIVSTGVIPQATTSSREWNQQAESFFYEWAKVADLRQRQSYWQMQAMCVSLRPTHGGLYFQLMDNGQLRPIECERIRDPQKEEDRKNCVDGVRIDPATGIRVAYCVHARDKDGGFGGPHSEQWVPAADMVPAITPFWRPDQVREIPDLAPVLPHIQDVYEMNMHTLNTAKAQSMFVGFLKKAGGLGANSMPRGSSAPTVGQRQVFRHDWGQILEGLPGDDLEMKVSATPNPQHIAYIQMQDARCAAGLDFPYEFFTLDFSKCDYSRLKGVLLLINHACRPWRKWLNDTVNQRVWNWRIAKAIKAKDLPPAPIDSRGISEWYHVEWQAPEELWIDRQEANQADMMAIQMGLDTASRAAKRRGLDLEDIRRERAEEIRMTAAVAKEYGISPDQLEKLQIPGQNGPAKESGQSVPIVREADEPEKPEETKDEDGV